MRQVTKEEKLMTNTRSINYEKKENIKKLIQDLDQRPKATYKFCRNWDKITNNEYYMNKKTANEDRQNY